MDWNQITQLPFFWKPFHSFPLTLLAILLVPAIFSFIIGAAMFKRRVGVCILQSSRRRSRPFSPS